MIRPHLVELEPLKSLPDLIHFLHKKRFLVIAVHERELQKWQSLPKFFSEEGQSDPQENGVMWPFFTSCAANPKILKMKSTMGIWWIWNNLPKYLGVRPHLVKSRYCKTLGSLKDAQILHHFLYKKIFWVVAAT